MFFLSFGIHAYDYMYHYLFANDLNMITLS